MAEFTQLPGTLNITAIAGDTVSIPIRLTGLDVTGYTISATTFALKQVAAGGGDYSLQIDPSPTPSTVALAVAVTAPATGDMTISFSDPNTLSQRWALVLLAPSTARRTAISGSFVLELP